MENKNYDLILKELGLIEEKIIFKNDRKKRVTSLVKDNNDKNYILKWNCESNKKELENLKNEIIFYNKLKYNFIPKLMKHGKNYILIEYIESYSLREWTLNYLKLKKDDFLEDEFKIVIKKMCEIFSNFYLINDKIKFEKRQLHYELKEMSNKLLLSGPMGTKPNVFYKMTNSIVRKLFLEKRVLNIVGQVKDLKSSFIHRDLHLNNLLIEKNKNKLFLIDLENSSEGLIVRDLCYIYPMLYLLLEGKENHRSYLEKIFYEKHPDKNNLCEYKKINKFLLKVISLNNRFRKDISILQYLKLLKDFILIKEEKVI
ncbi:phosphotransferase [uncultured Ilyobacter sp.]|uniref:phosphotransferase n=1 Tax=uncultured Ilyobacter sp. TaxID=544433 RepID=UPI0029F5B80C|nr:phosphotransferase [uncultured Ilyobacter sp.]